MTTWETHKFTRYWIKGISPQGINCTIADGVANLYVDIWCEDREDIHYHLGALDRVLGQLIELKQLIENEAKP